VAYPDQEHLQHGGRKGRRSLLFVFAITSGLLVGVGGGTTTAQDEPAKTGGGAFSKTSDVAYMTIDGREIYVDIFAPTSDGPWPVVVAFHGLGSRSDPTTSTVAAEAAAQGMLVFTPTWIDEHAFPLTADGLGVLRQGASCAVAFAQQRAAELGGDSDRTAVYGFSAGYGPAMWAALAPEEGTIPGCATDESATRPNGVVAGDGEYFLYTETFDAAFDIDPVAMQAQAAAFVDPAAWPSDLDVKFFLWTAGAGTNPRTVGDVTDETGWLAQRDPTGSIRADLERLGQLEDGIITFVDAGRLMADRLASAGLEVTLDEYPGSHTTLDKVPELIGYIQAAAGD
jgi:acetyl esterase/lipase